MNLTKNKLSVLFRQRLKWRQDMMTVFSASGILYLFINSVFLHYLVHLEKEAWGWKWPSYNKSFVESPSLIRLSRLFEAPSVETIYLAKIVAALLTRIEKPKEMLCYRLIISSFATLVNAITSAKHDISCIFLFKTCQYNSILSSISFEAVSCHLQSTSQVFIHYLSWIPAQINGR